MRELPLKALRVFESVARRGSFKAAAEELCVSQSAVSHQIKHLEDWLGQPLFERAGHRPQLQGHGQILSAALHHAFLEIDAACQVAQLNTASKALIIASIPSVAICWLIPRLPGFQRKYPDITTRMVYAFHGQDIDFNQVDLAFVYAKSPPVLPGHRTRLFKTGTSVPVCSPTLYDTLDLAQLPNAIMAAGLLHDADINGWTDWLKQTQPDPMSTVTGPIFEDFNMLRAAALAGQGIALCPLALIENDLASNRLIQLSSISIHQSFNYYLICRDTNNPETGTASDRFADWVFDDIEQDNTHEE